MLAGGRPVSALAKDCCYRDISTLAEDLQRLQKQKAQCEANYEQAIKGQKHALGEIDRLKDDNEKLSHELKQIKDVALSVESEANLSLDALHKSNTSLRLKLHESKKRIHELESQMCLTGEYDAKDLKEANMNIKFLKEQLRSVSEKGEHISFTFFVFDNDHFCNGFVSFCFLALRL